MGVRFHVVCHECTEEGVYGDREAARATREEHVDETGHRVSMKDITGPTV